MNSSGKRPPSAFAQARILCLLVGLLVLPILLLHAAPPAWWSQRGATNANPPDNTAVANLGQLKHIASKAAAELNANLPDGAGSTINNLITTWQQPPATGVTRDDTAALTVGQLKSIAAPFYDRLFAVGYTGQPLSAGQKYPWDNSLIPTDNMALANLGQLKQIFAFGLTNYVDADGVPNSWKQRIVDANPNDGITSASQVLPGDDFDGDGVSNLEEFSMQTDPTDSQSGGNLVVHSAQGVQVVVPTWEAQHQLEYPSPYLVDYTKIEIRWSPADSSQTGFKVEKQVENGGWQTLTTTGPGSTICNDENLLANCNYSYRVIALGNGGKAAEAVEVNYNVPLNLRFFSKRTGGSKDKRIGSYREFGVFNNNFYLSQRITQILKKQVIRPYDGYESSNRNFDETTTFTSTSDPVAGTVVKSGNFHTKSVFRYDNDGLLSKDFIYDEISQYTASSQSKTAQSTTSSSTESFTSESTGHDNKTDNGVVDNHSLVASWGGHSHIQNTLFAANGRPFWNGDGYEYVSGDYSVSSGFSDYTDKDGNTINAVFPSGGTWSVAPPYTGSWEHSVSTPTDTPTQQTSTSKTWSYSYDVTDSADIDTATTSVTLSQPYTDAILKAGALANVSDYPQEFDGYSYDWSFSWATFFSFADGYEPWPYLKSFNRQDFASTGITEDGTYCSVSKTRYKFTANPSTKQTVSWFEVFYPEDDPSTTDVDESQKFQVVNSRNWMMGQGTESAEYEIEPDPNLGNGFYSIVLLPVVLKSHDRVLRGSIEIDESFHDVELSFKNKTTNQDLGNYQKMESGAVGSSVKIYDSPNDFFSDAEMQQNKDGALPENVLNQKVTFVRDPANPTRLEFCAVFDDVGEVELNAKFHSNGTEVTATATQTLTKDSVMADFINQLNERVVSIEVPGSEELPIDIDGDGVPDGSGGNDLIQGSQAGSMAIPGALLSEELEDDPLNLVLPINNDDDTEDGINQPDNQDGVITNLDNDVVRLLLKRPGNLLGNVGTLTLTTSNNSAVRVFNSTGTHVLNSYVVDLAAPAGDLAGLATGSVPIYLEGLAAASDVTFTLTYRNQANEIVASDSVHLTVGDSAQFALIQTWHRPYGGGSRIDVRSYAANGALRIETLDLVTIGQNPPLHFRGMLSKVLWEATGHNLQVPFVNGFIDGFWVALKGEKETVVGAWEFFQHDPFGRAAAMTAAVGEAMGKLSTIPPSQIPGLLKTMSDNITFQLYTAAENQLPWESTSVLGEDVAAYMLGFGSGTVAEGVAVSALGVGVATKACTVVKGILAASKTGQIALETLNNIRKATVKITHIQLQLARSESGAINIGSIGKFLEKTEMPNGKRATEIIEEAFHDKAQLTKAVEKIYDEHWPDIVDEGRRATRYQKCLQSLADLKVTMGNALSDEGLESFTKLQGRMFVTGSDSADCLPKIKQMFNLDSSAGRTEFNQFLENSKAYLDNPQSEIREGFFEVLNRGAAGARVDKVYTEGTILTRHGAETGKFLSEGDPPFWSRSLPDSNEVIPKKYYRVKQAFTAKSSRTAPYYGKVGGCLQLDLENRSVAELLPDYIEEITP